MFGKVKPENLPRYLRKINQLFPEYGSGQVIDVAHVKRYYAESFWGYAIFHSWAGAIHMALSPSGHFYKNDYFRQAEEVGDLLSKGVSHEARILEVGCGRGFNLHYLAETFPRYKFVGVDLSDRNLVAARKDLDDLCNVSLVANDFHSLDSIATDSVSLAFAVESLCHAVDLPLAFRAISRVLKRGGRLVVFDAFRDASKELSADTLLAASYAEHAMAVPSFKRVTEFVAAAEAAGFRLEYVQDRSGHIMPNLIRLSDFAKGFFKIGPLSHVLMMLLPRALVENAIAGLLMAVTVKTGAHRYFKVCLRKAPGRRVKSVATALSR